MRQERTGLARQLATGLGAPVKSGGHAMDSYEMGFWVLLSYIVVREIYLATTCLV